MATWQFSVNLIPKSWAIVNNFRASLLYTENGFDTEIAWKNNQLTPEFIETLSKLLPPAKSWSENLLCWGSEEEHDIQVSLENESIEGVNIRIDLNQKLNKIINKIVITAKKIDCVFFFPEYRTITEANEFELKRALQNSQAAQFVKSPTSFLSKLQKT